MWGRLLTLLPETNLVCKTTGKQDYIQSPQCCCLTPKPNLDSSGYQPALQPPALYCDFMIHTNHLHHHHHPMAWVGGVVAWMWVWSFEAARLYRRAFSI